MPSPWIGIVFSLGVFGVLMLLLSRARRRGLHPELARKGLHVGMGAVALTYPWIFDRNWPVILLSVIGVAALAAFRWARPMRRRMGGPIHDVDRHTVGEILFPVAVATTFAVAGDDPFLYWIPIACMTVADAAAALVGLQYGRMRFTTGGKRKSTEGSIVFFTVAFLVTHLILLLATDTPRLDCVLIGLTLGALVMVLEAVSLWGVDNFLVPVGATFLLAHLRGMTTGRLVEALVVTFTLVALVLTWRRKATLNDAALLVAAFYGYVAWAAGGLVWMVAPLTLFLTYAYLAPKTSLSRLHVQSSRAVLSVVLTASVWLLLAHGLGRPELLYPYSLGFAAHLAMIVLVRLRHGSPARSVVGCLTSCVLESWLLILVPWGVIAGWSGRNALLLAFAFVPVALATCWFARWQPDLPSFPSGLSRWVREGVAATATSALGLIPLYVW